MDANASGRLRAVVPRPRAEKRTPQAPEGLAPEGDGEGGASVVVGFGPTLSLPMNY